jgi:hypothetical protein
VICELYIGQLHYIYVYMFRHLLSQLTDAYGAGGVLRWVSASGALKPEVPELQAALELPLSMLESADKSDTVLKSASEKRGLRVSDKELKQMLADM